jgi:hypothetical protein
MPPRETATAHLTPGLVLDTALRSESMADLSKKLGLKTTRSIYDWLTRHGIERDEVKRRFGSAQEPGFTSNDDGSAVIVSAAQTNDPPTIEDLLRAHKLDPAEWRVVRQRVNAWNAMTSDKAHGDNRVVTMHQLRIELVPTELLLQVPDPGDWTPPPAPKQRRRDADEPRRTVVVGDHHAPHQDRIFHALFLLYLADEKPDVIDVNGDLGDWATVSRHRERKGFSQGANEVLRESYRILRDYRHACPNARIRLKRGNHDERLLYAMIDNVRELHEIKPAEEELPALDFRRLLHLDELHVDYIDVEWDRAKTPLGQRLSARHGFSTSKNATDVMLTKLAGSTIQGHTHRLELRFRTSHTGDEEIPTETRMAAQGGCACEIKDGLGYVPGGEPDWQQGALLNYVWDGGDFLTQPIVYVPGRLLAPNGRRYEAVDLPPDE